MLPKGYKDDKEKIEDHTGDDLNYSFLTKTFASLSKSQKEKILQVLRNIGLDRTG